MTDQPTPQIIHFEDASALEAWLADHYGVQCGIWVKIAKKNSGVASVTHPEALDVALCHGWIDGQRKACDETYYLQKFTPRRARSLWSQVNIRKVEGLVAAGRMREPGFSKILAAKADGRWDAAYESQRDSTAPPDLAAALEQNQVARDSFEQLGRTEKYTVILHLLRARTPGARAAQLQRMITLMEAGQQVR
ncbi:YdeI/OmpD-associated family protein [Streptomyces sp. H27-C3]|uniref:YdeI/OmpD-associated family protein n=1 Tax=Streptomyces sp. H27-C3 TaxID=3046305 RepID=UPI0024BA7818|nr:YdeI/OmpD-associated family protein [Streptomyces sp. H27-C3]MDJ0460231.1 YdeI/OmpD-associated family protein [Streptomyces sp. H27-C3]